MYKLLVDIKYCFGLTTALKPKGGYPRDALRAGIVLIALGFRNLVKKIFQGEFENFGKQFMQLENNEVKALSYFRNALEHNFYSFSYVHNDKKQCTKTRYNFYLSIKFEKAIEKFDANSISTEGVMVEKYGVNPRKVYIAFTSGLEKFKTDLLNKKSKYRKSFKSSFNLDYWTAVYPINSP